MFLSVTIKYHPLCIFGSQHLSNFAFLHFYRFRVIAFLILTQTHDTKHLDKSNYLDVFDLMQQFSEFTLLTGQAAANIIDEDIFRVILRRVLGVISGMKCTSY
jgi:hypothetical protein